MFSIKDVKDFKNELENAPTIPTKIANILLTESESFSMLKLGEVEEYDGKLYCGGMEVISSKKISCDMRYLDK